MVSEECEVRSPQGEGRQDRAGHDNRVLSASAPAFVHSAKVKPHLISVFNPVDYSTAQLHCNLATLMVEELRAFTSGHFGIPVDCFDLLLGGQPLPADTGLKAIDVGIGNGAVAVLHLRTCPAMVQPAMHMPVQMIPPAPSQQMVMAYHMVPPPMVMGGGMPGQMPFMTGGSPPLTPMGGSPAPSPLHAGPQGVPLQQVGLEFDRAQQMAMSRPPMGTVAHAPSHDALSSLPSSNSTTAASLPPSRGTSPPISHDAPLSAGDFCSYALTSDGSRALIYKLQSLGDVTEFLTQLLPMLRPKFPTLATHQHASKVLSAIAALATPQQVSDLISMAAADVCELAESNAGSDVLVSFVNLLPDATPESGPVATVLVEAMIRFIVPLCTSVNGRKVLQAVVTKLGPLDVKPLYDAVCQNLMNLATDQCGCITIQRLYDFASDTTLRTLLQVQILEFTPHLITDPYGNYVLQHAIKDVPLCSQIVARQISGRVLDLATNKFASNVMERCMQAGPDDVREALVLEICQPLTLATLIQDAFGNYVVQSAVDHAPYVLLDVLKQAITPLITRSPYGYRIETKLQRRLKRCGRAWARSKEARAGRQQVRSLTSNQGCLQLTDVPGDASLQAALTNLYGGGAQQRLTIEEEEVAY